MKFHCRHCGEPYGLLTGARASLEAAFYDVPLPCCGHEPGPEEEVIVRTHRLNR